jgi:hypothetical protein
VAENLHGEAWPEHGPTFTKEGVVFFDTVDVPYEDFREIGECVVTWEELDDPEATLKKYELMAEERKRQQEKDALEWSRKQYEKLREQFEVE